MKAKKRSNSKKGFTLVELVIVMSIVVIVTTMTVSLSVSTHNVVKKNNVIAEQSVELSAFRTYMEDWFSQFGQGALAGYTYESNGFPRFVAKDSAGDTTEFVFEVRDISGASSEYDYEFVAKYHGEVDVRRFRTKHIRKVIVSTVDLTDNGVENIDFFKVEITYGSYPNDGVYTFLIGNPAGVSQQS